MGSPEKLFRYDKVKFINISIIKYFHDNTNNKLVEMNIQLYKHDYH